MKSLSKELKPVAYIYPQYEGSGPDNYHEEGPGLILIDELDNLAGWEKDAGEPLYAIPEGFALVPIEPNNGWTSVEDKLPTESGVYWCYRPKKHHCSDYQEPEVFCEINNCFDGLNDHEITHWRKLPEAPNNGNSTARGEE